MVIEPKFRNNIFLNSHPVGCAAEVRRQIDYVTSRGPIQGPKKVLVVGSSTGYGLASRIVAAFGCSAETIGVSLERAGDEKRTGSAGWYNTVAFDREAKARNRKSASLNIDAFTTDSKRQVVELAASTPGKFDLFVYSLASPVRTDPATGMLHRSVLKPLGKPYAAHSVDVMTGEVKEFRVEPATETELADTIKVMGGEDWLLWLQALLDADLVADSMLAIAYSYVGPEVTYPIYREGTIGRAKEDLERTALKATALLAAKGGRAIVSINKAVVTRSSAVIPVVPLYISLLFKVMKEKGLHEDCIMQIRRLFAERLYTKNTIPTDDEGRVRIDDWELRNDVQTEVAKLWSAVSTSNFERLADAAGYRMDFLQIHGFAIPGVDYGADVEP